MFNEFLVNSFREATMREVHTRIKTYVDPDAAWSPFLMMDANSKFLATSLPEEHFKNPETLERLFEEYIPETITNLHADMAAFIKPVWIGKVPKNGEPEDVNHFHQGILMIMATPNQLEGWVAPIIRTPDQEPTLGKFIHYTMEYDNMGKWVRAAFNKILEQQGGEEEHEVDTVPLD